MSHPAGATQFRPCADAGCRCRAGRRIGRAMPVARLHAPGPPPRCSGPPPDQMPRRQIRFARPPCPRPPVPRTRCPRPDAPDLPRPLPPCRASAARIPTVAWTIEDEVTPPSLRLRCHASRRGPASSGAWRRGMPKEPKARRNPGEIRRRARLDEPGARSERSVDGLLGVTGACRRGPARYGRPVAGGTARRNGPQARRNGPQEGRMR